MTHSFGLVIESLVAFLLILTIGYCVMLNKRLCRFKADETMFKATIGELVAATEIAERAIAGLKLTVQDCDRTLGERLRTAERFSAEIERQVEAGDDVVAKLGRIVAATRGAETAPAPVTALQPAAMSSPDTRATLMAAQAFADRARLRMDGRAA